MYNIEHKKLLEREAFSAVFTYSSRKEMMRQMADHAEVIIGNPPIVRSAAKLKLVQLESAGADQYVKRAAPK